MAKINEYTAAILQAVEEDCDVEADEVLSRCGTADVVDARHIAVFLLHEQGFSTSRIARAMMISKRYAQHIITRFADRIKYNRLIRNTYERIKTKLREDKAVMA